MGIFDIFKKKKGANDEMDRERELITILIDSKAKLDKIKAIYGMLKSDIENATNIPIEKRESLFEKGKDGADRYRVVIVDDIP